MTDDSIPPPPDLPPELAPSPAPEGPRLPWEERQSLGFFPALVETMRLLVTQPGEAFGRLRQDGDYVSPLLFGGLIAWVSAIIGQLWSSAFSGMLAGFSGMSPEMLAGGGIFRIAMVTVLFPVIYGIGLVIGLGIFHGFLLLVGGLSESRMGVEGTFKVISYSQLASLGNVVPILGWVVTIVAQIIFLVVGFQTVHRTTQGKALAGALLPLLLCCVCVGVAISLGVAGALFAAGANG